MVKKVIQKKKKTAAPAWATKPFKSFLNYVINLEHLLMLSIKGIHMLMGVPKLVEALAKLDSEEESESTQNRIATAKKEAELAQYEVDNGFPLLHAQAVVSLWGTLESQIRSFLATWIVNNPQAKKANAIQKIKIQLGEYEGLSKEERSYYVLDLLERELQAPLKQGVTRFESLLEIFGLGGGIDDAIRRDLFELNQVRNVIVHRNRIADKKFITACPWMKTKIGETIVITNADYRRYSNAALSYTTELVIRLAVYYGKNRDEFVEGFLKDARKKGATIETSSEFAS